MIPESLKFSHWLSESLLIWYQHQLESLVYGSPSIEPTAYHQLPSFWARDTPDCPMWRLSHPLTWQQMLGAWHIYLAPVLKGSFIQRGSKWETVKNVSNLLLSLLLLLFLLLLYLVCATFLFGRWSQLPSGKLTMEYPHFQGRKYIFNPGPFSSQLC